MSGDPLHPSPHDALFKRVFGELERGGAMLRAALPAELARSIRWESLRLLPGETVGAELRGLSSDLVFAAKLGDREALVYVLIEHQSTPDPRMPFRILEYVTRLWERHSQPVEGRLALPLVVPLVVYHGPRPWRVPLELGETVALDDTLELGELVPRLRYLLDDLSRLDAAALRARGLPAFGTLALWALRSAFDRGFMDTASELAGLVDELLDADTGHEAMASVLSYLSYISRSGEDLVARFRSHLSARAQEEVMELEEMLAIKKREEGRAEGRAEILVKQLRLKFGEPSPATVQRVRDGSEADLDRWAERVLTATRLAEVFD